MQLTQIAERAKAQLAMATNLEPLIVSGADKEPDGWRLTVEMIELDRIPEAQGIIGADDVRLQRRRRPRHLASNRHAQTR